MDDLQLEFERITREAQDAGKRLTAKELARIVEQTAKGAGRELYKTLMETAPNMLTLRRKEFAGFETRNGRRWRKAFDLLDTIWVSCEEVGRAFNRHHRPAAAAEQDYAFEAMTHLHAKALLVTAEIICLLKGGFADGALARWRTLHETNVIASLIRQEGQELALRYLAHSRVQAWLRVAEDAENTDEMQRLEKQAAHAIEKFGPDLKRRNGWACELTGQQNPTFKKLSALAGKSEEDEVIYKYASHHIHSNHRAFDELLGMSEAKEDLLLVGPSNSGMTGPLTLAAMSMVESTSFLLNAKPNIDRMAFVDALMRMASRMNKLASGLERRTLESANRKQAASRAADPAE